MARAVTEVLDDYRGLIAQAQTLLTVCDHTTVNARQDDSWSLKERLGHLIDAAVNMVQIAVRAPLDEVLAFPGYDSVSWVRVQGYAERDWPVLLSLYIAVSGHLLEALHRVPADKWATPCLIGRGKPKRLEEVLAEHARHLRRHLKHFDTQNGQSTKVGGESG